MKNKSQKAELMALPVIILFVAALFSFESASASRQEGFLKTYTDTSHLDIQDSIDSNCPNLPPVAHYKSGRAFYGFGQMYDSADMHEIEHWIEDFPSEADEFSRLVSAFASSTDLSTLTYTQRGIYNDLHTIWIAIRHGHH
ncbi:MAG: hypothetical protein JNL57_04340 [Bacteroidetes bacterium]|nr:hypothetical protein [Bacteroidota bacterium]